jgi:hypothetical protein
MSPRRALSTLHVSADLYSTSNASHPEPKSAGIAAPRFEPSGRKSAPSLECRHWQPEDGHKGIREGVSDVEQPISSNGPISLAHRILDRLTAMKLRVGSMRLRLRLGVVAPAEIEKHLDHIEQEIDATAALAQDMQAEGSSSG